jgi:hypothetical protein
MPLWQPLFREKVGGALPVQDDGKGKGKMYDSRARRLASSMPSQAGAHLDFHTLPGDKADLCEPHGG